MTRTLRQISAAQVQLFKLFIISALLLSAALFSYKAEGPQELHNEATVIAGIAESHVHVKSRHHTVVKILTFTDKLLETIVVTTLAASLIRTIPLSIIRAFIPQKIKDLFLMPVKFTSNYIHA